MDIRLIDRADIDETKWNSCVHYAVQGDIFGYIWFLDNISKDWCGLVEGDYESVFPVFFRKNLLRQVSAVQPIILPTLGIYSIRVLSKKREETFLTEMAGHFKRWNISLNGRHTPPKHSDYQQQQYSNFELWLNQSYDDLSANYEQSFLASGYPDHWRLTSSVKPEQIAAFYKDHAPRQARLEDTFHALQRIMYNALHRGLGGASAVKDGDGHIRAATFHLLSHGRAICLATSHVPGPGGRASACFSV